MSLTDKEIRMGPRVLITGGAGFIGSHLADELLDAGYRVRLFDMLHDQVHGADATWPSFVPAGVELMAGDVREIGELDRALEGVQAVVHLAAMVGVGQSMFAISDYVAVNDLGTANLLECLAKRPVERLLVASSMSIYGEGLYRDAEGGTVRASQRTAEQLKAGEWDPKDAAGRPLWPLPTPETKEPELASVYALTKFSQERMCLLVGGAYGIPTTALRFFNAYGPRQALSNPYTGVLAIFASRLMNGKAPILFEDGRQIRDFVHVKDVARACRLALERPQSAGRAINVASGESIAVQDLASRFAVALGRQEIPIAASGRYRVGDIRHCFADIGLARELLGFQPAMTLADGMADLAEWLRGRTAVDHVERMTRELMERGLVA
jgi:dTDP-L-rhamnose 4-epimerase